MAGTEQATKVSTEAGRKVRDGVRTMLTDKDSPGLGVRTISNVAGATVATSTAIIMAIFGAAFRVAAELAAIFLESLEGTVRDNQDAMNDLIAASMTDLLSVDVTGSDIGAGGEPAAQLKRAQQIGGKLHDLLLQEFGGGSGPDGVNGEKAARAFTGFNISFSVRAALLSIVTEIESLGFFKEFREIGEEMAQNLGLGRLHRQALRPLIQHLITSPYDRELSARYRQHRMSDREYIESFHSGYITIDELNTHLSEHGYTDADMFILTETMRKRLSLEEIAVLNAYGVLFPAVTANMGKQAGYDAVTWQQKLDVLRFKHVQQQEHAYADDILALAKDRFISSAEFSALLERLHFSDDEKQVWRDRLGVHLDSHRRRLSLSEMRFLAENNQITSSDLHKWAVESGYSEDDAFLLEIDLALREQTGEEKLAIATYRYLQAVAKAKKKGEAIPPAPPGVHPVS